MAGTVSWVPSESSIGFSHIKKFFALQSRSFHINDLSSFGVGDKDLLDRMRFCVTGG